MMAQAEYQHRYYEANKERLKAYRKSYYEAHRAEIIAKNKKRDAEAMAADPVGFRATRNALTSRWAKEHPEVRREASRAWRRRNAAYMLAKQREWYAKPENRTRALSLRREATKRLRAEVITAYGGHCACCGETREPFLSIDHVNGDGGAHRRLLGARGDAIYRDLKKRGWPQDGYRLLCMNCNFAIRNGDPCPHVVAQADELLAGVLCA